MNDGPFPGDVIVLVYPRFLWSDKFATTDIGALHTGDCAFVINSTYKDQYNVRKVYVISEQGVGYVFIDSWRDVT